MIDMIKSNPNLLKKLPKESESLFKVFNQGSQGKSTIVKNKMPSDYLKESKMSIDSNSERHLAAMSALHSKFDEFR